MKYPPVDSPVAPPVRVCGVASCHNVARPGGWRCRAHHRLDVRQWRSKNAAAIKARRRDSAAHRDAKQQAADSARAKVAMALKRGKIQRGACMVCGKAQVTAYIVDPQVWWEVRWVCREDRHEVVPEIREREQEHTIQARWNARRDGALSIFERLSPEVQAEIRTLARRNPVFRDRELEIDSPLYLSKLVSEVEKRVDHAPLRNS